METTASKCIIGQASAGNPFMAPWERIPDGEPRVFTDPHTGSQRMYVYGSHDTTVRIMWSGPRRWMI